MVVKKEITSYICIIRFLGIFSKFIIPDLQKSGFCVYVCTYDCFSLQFYSV